MLLEDGLAIIHNNKLYFYKTDKDRYISKEVIYKFLDLIEKEDHLHTDLFNYIKETIHRGYIMNTVNPKYYLFCGFSCIDKIPFSNSYPIDKVIIFE